MERSPDYGKRKISAQRLAEHFEDLRQALGAAALDELERRNKVQTLTATVALAEAMAIDAWLSSFPDDKSRREAYGSNDTDRGRNTLIMLGNNEEIKTLREELRQAEHEHALARIRLEDLRESQRAAHSIAYAYGAECALDAAVVNSSQLFPEGERA